MHRENLARAIKSATASQLRELASLVLRARGFHPIDVDGAWDGGRDLLVYVLPPRPLEYAIAVSVEPQWDKKMREDAAKNARRGRTQMEFFSSVGISDSKFLRVADEIRRDLAVQVTRWDPKMLAGFFVEDGLVARALAVLGMDGGGQAREPELRQQIRRDIAYACAFFGAAVQDFRHGVIASAIQAFLSTQERETAEFAVTVARVAADLALPENQRPAIEDAIVALVSDGVVQRDGERLSLRADAAVSCRALRALREREQRELSDELGRLLPSGIAPQERGDVVAGLMEHLGVLLMNQPQWISRREVSSAFEPMRERLRAIDAQLDIIGVTETGPRRALLQKIAATAGRSAFGKALVAGEMFISLLHLRTPHLLAAFGNERGLRIVLDTSVAMPMLCNVLYREVDHELFVGAAHLYRQLEAHRLRPLLPRVYLEEFASHLLEAPQYAPMIGEDEDLRGSANVFVAHYASMRRAPRPDDTSRSFAEYLEGFAPVASLRLHEFAFAKRQLMTRLEPLLRHYGIEVIDTAPQKQRRVDAETSVEFLRREHRISSRPPINLDHDIDVLAWLAGQESSDAVQVLTTWDRLHLLYSDQEYIGWDALGPQALGDVLGLAAPLDDLGPVLSPLCVALAMDTSEAARGAAVWDALVGYEGSKLGDADLRRLAAQFKKEFLARHKHNPGFVKIVGAWEEWKSLFVAPAVPMPGGSDRA